jgi:hypothetical protein
MAEILVLAAHPQMEHSRVTRTLMRAAARAAPARTEVRDLYALYPDHVLGGEAERAALVAAHERFRTGCSAFITACNPFGEDVGAASSAQRHADLRQELARRSRAHVAGIGQHPASQWAGAASDLAFGWTLEAAKTPGRDLSQNAIVWSDADAVPRLILLR